MSLLLLEGFDDGLMLERWVGNFTTRAPVSNRVGAVADMWTHGGTRTLSRNLPAADEHATITTGFYFYYTSSGGDPSWLSLRSDSGAVQHVNMYVDTAGRIIVVVAAGTYTSDIVWSGTGTAHYIELQATLHDTTGAFTVWVDGNVVLSETNIDTKSGGTKTVFDQVRFTSDATGTLGTRGELDDIYITNGAGAAPYDGNLGDVVVDTLFPNANGNYSQWAGSDGNSVDNYLLVDEVTPDNDTTYVSQATDGQRDSYGFDDLVYATGVIRGVIATAVCRNEGTADNIKISARIAAADYDGATLPAPAGYDAQVEQRWELSPATAADWTIAEVNAAEFGVQNVA